MRAYDSRGRRDAGSIRHRPEERTASRVHPRASIEQVRADFDELARLVGDGESGRDRYDGWLLSLVPTRARSVLDVGCGMGRLTRALATEGREVMGVDLSPAMIARARAAGRNERVTFLEGSFLDLDFVGRRFDCVVSVAALHHMPEDAALSRMIGLLAPGGRLIVHDLRRNHSLGESLRAGSALAHDALLRLMRTGRAWSPRHVRKAWNRHGAREVYLSLREARTLADRLLPGALVFNHWLWRYTIVWDMPQAA